MSGETKGIVSVTLTDGSSRTISVTSRTIASHVVELVLQKFPGANPADYSLIQLGKLVPVASPSALTEGTKHCAVGTTLADSERVLDVQLGWGVNNPGGYRFKLVYKQGLVKVQFKGVPEIDDDLYGAVHCTAATTVDAFCEVVANDYGLAKKKKYQLVNSLLQSNDEHVLSKNEKPAAVRIQTEKTNDIPHEQFFFTFMVKQDNWFSKASRQASKFVSTIKLNDAAQAGGKDLSKAGSSSKLLSVVGAPVLTSGVTNDDIPIPSEEDLNREFLQLLSALNIKDDVRARMLNDDPKRKWKLVLQHRTEEALKSGATGGGGERKDPVQYIESLQKKSTQLKTLISLRVELNSAPVPWIQQFLDSQGLVAIQTVLQKIFERRNHKLDQDEDVQLEGLRCIRGILNTEPGLRDVLASPPIVHNIAVCIAGTNVKLPLLAQELLAALCILSPRGHSLVLESLGLFATSFEEQYRFQTIIEYIDGRKGYHAHTYDLQTMALSLMNAIVNAPESISVRIKLREELQRRGLNQLLQSMRHDAPPDLTTQINVYIEENDADAADASTVLKSKGYDLNNPGDLATEVVKRVTAARTQQTYQHLLAILQSLVMFVPDMTGVQEWAIADLFLQKLSSLRGQNIVSAWPPLVQDFLRTIEDMTGASASIGLSRAATRAGDHDVPVLKSRLQEKDATIMSLSRQVERLQLDLTEALSRQSSTTGGDVTLGYLQTISDLNNKIVEYEEQIAQAQSEAQRFYQTQLNTVIAQQQQEFADQVEQREQLAKRHKEEIAELLQQVDASPAALLEAQNEAKRLNALLEQTGDARSKELQIQLTESLAKQQQLEQEKSDLLKKLANSGNSSEGPIGSNDAPPPPPPPAAPPLDVGGPPPPAPPPPPMAGGPPGPPPPPGIGAAPAVPSKKAIKPKVPLKQYNWTKIPNVKIEDTIWKTISDEGVKVNANELESLFAKAASTKPDPAPAAGAAAAPSAAVAAAAKKPATVTLLEMNRANNIAIMLARLKLPNSEIKKAILTLDESKLSVDVLRMLKQFVPSDDELETVREYDGDPNSLGIAEKYFREIADIPKFGARINAMIFVRRYASSVDEVKPDIDTMAQAIAEVKQSRKLTQILQVCLAIGNYLNGSTFRGEAYGFKLDALNKLAETKAADGTTTLLHYITRTLEQQDPSLIDFLSTMPHVDAAGRLSLPTIVGAVKDLKAGLSDIENVVNATQAASDDQFAAVMQQFIGSTQTAMQALLKETEQLEQSYKQLLVHFAEEDTTQPEDFFPILVKFSQDLKRAQKENLVPPKPVAAASAGGLAAPVSPARLPGMPALEKGELDNALKGLREGNAFRHKRENRRSQVFTGEQNFGSDAAMAADKLAGKKGQLVLPKQGK